MVTMTESQIMKISALNKWILLSGMVLLTSSLTFADTPKTDQPPATQSTEQKPADTAAKPMIGQVVWVKGNAKAIGEDKVSRPLVRRSPIYVHDTLVTEKGGTGQIVFSDNSLVALREDTTVKIDDFKFGKDVPPEKATFVANVVKGGFRTVSGLIPKENKDGYKVKTPVATIAIQGTEYAVYYSDRTKLFVKYYSGVPCITNSGGSMCLSNANQISKVSSPAAPPVPVKAAPGVFEAQPPITTKDAAFNPAAKPETAAPTTTPASSTSTSSGAASSTEKPATSETKSSNSTSKKTQGGGGSFCIVN